MSVKPMAGSARSAPAIIPLTRSWDTFSSTSGLHLDDFAVPHLARSELDIEDIADLAELAWARGARVLDLLAFGDRFEAVDCVVDLHGIVVIGDLADVVADRRAARLAAFRHCKNRQVHVVVSLADVGVERVAFDQRLESSER